MSDLDIERLMAIANDEATRIRRRDGRVEFNELLKAIGTRLGRGFEMVPLDLVLDAMEAAEAASRLH